MTMYRIKSTTAGLVLRIASVLLTLACAAAAGTRRDYSLNADWRFIREDVPGAEKLDFDAGGWAKVSCPHTWNDIDTFDDFGKGGHQGESNLWEGAAWYRKDFTLPEGDAGRRVFIEFEGVRQVADVWLNGHHLGQDRTGFIPFGFDLTPYMNFGGGNVLAVRADNTVVEQFEGDMPWNHQNWHPPHGGIYRNVRLHVMDAVHVTLPLLSHLGTEGIYAWTAALTKERAEIGVTAEVENSLGEGVDALVRFSISDPDGTVVGTVDSPVKLAAGARTKVAASLAVANPKLWEPAYPAVYRVSAAIVANGETGDLASTSFGIRNFRFDAATGFHIDGHPLKLHGWGQKPIETWAGLGAALPDKLHEYTLHMMKEAGGNMLRWGHCAGPPVGAEACDRYGFVTIMPGVDGERDCTGKAWATRTAAFASMIVYYRNHPSICVWEGGNYNVSPAHAAEMRKIVEKRDPHGRRYFGFRMATPGMLPSIDLELGTIGRTRALPSLPVIETEYDRSEVPRRVWDKFSPPDFGHLGKREEENTYRMDQEEFAVNAIRDWWTKFGSDPAHSGGANWIFSDGPHGSRQVTDVVRASGEVDAVRLPKEAYFALQTAWSGEPAVHLIGHWSYPRDTVKTVYAVARADAAELFVNGRSLGMGERSLDTLFEWKDVKFEPGKIRVAALRDGKVVAEQVKETAGAPESLKLTQALAKEGWKADGSDIALVDFEVVDARGRRCPTDQARVDFTISGPGIWRGGYNSGKENSTNHPYLDTECGINRVSVRSVLTAGKVVLTASREGLKSATLELESTPLNLTGGLLPIPDFQPAALPERPEIDAAALAELAVKRDEPPPAPAKSAGDGGGLFATMQYTGEGAGGLEDKLTPGALAYSDDAVLAFGPLPKILSGATIVRTASGDAGYWANDYIVATAARDLDFYVAHDPKVPQPAWLKSYEKLKEGVKVGNVRMELYKTHLKAGGDVRISGNAGQGVPVKSPLNLILFARAAES